MHVNTNDVDVAANQIAQAASPITSCVDGLQAVTGGANPGVTTSAAMTTAAHKWATTLHQFASDFATLAAKMRSTASTYTEQEQVISRHFGP